MSTSIYSLPVVFAVSALLLTACDSKSSSSGAATNTNTTASSSPLTAPVDYLGALGKSKEIAVKTTDIASLTRAIQMFNEGEGRNPATLNELVTEKYLPRLPDPPYGMKFTYEASSGVVKVVKK